MNELTSFDLFGDKFSCERMWGLRELVIDFDVSWGPQTQGWGVLGISFLLVLLVVVGVLGIFPSKVT